MCDIEKYICQPGSLFAPPPQELVRLLPASYLGKLGLFQAPNLIELVVDAYKVREHSPCPPHSFDFVLCYFLASDPVVSNLFFLWRTRRRTGRDERLERGSSSSSSTAQHSTAGIHEPTH